MTSLVCSRADITPNSAGLLHGPLLLYPKFAERDYACVIERLRGRNLRLSRRYDGCACQTCRRLAGAPRQRRKSVIGGTGGYLVLSLMGALAAMERTTSMPCRQDSLDL